MSADGARRFRRDQRLLDSRDFTRVLRAGRRRSCEEFAVVLTERRTAGERGGPGRPGSSRDRSGSRLGLTVGRKAGCAVERNRFKRRVREWFRQHQATLPSAVDIVVIARRSGVELDFQGLSDRLAKLLDVNSVRSRNQRGSSA